MATVSSIIEHIEITPGTCGGKPHIAGQRITVQDIVIWHEHHGMSTEEIVSQFEELSLADVYAALVYYHDHRSEVDQGIERDSRFAAELEASQPSLVDQALERVRRMKQTLTQHEGGARVHR